LLQAGRAANIPPVSNSFGQNSASPPGAKATGQPWRGHRRLPGAPAAATEEIQADLDRRRPGQSDITTPARKPNKAEILPGCSRLTTGVPISLVVHSSDQRPGAYDEMKEKFRPSHADYNLPGQIRPSRPSRGRAILGRETIGRVAAGAVARKILHLAHKLEIRAYVTQIHDIIAPPLVGLPTLAEVEANAVRCPDESTARA